MEKAFKYRIYPTQAQRLQIAKTIGCARLVYNDALDCRKLAWDVGCISLNYNWTSQSLTELKKHLSFLKEADKFALQNVLKDLDRAYKNFFAGRAKYPHFKRKHSHKQSYRTNFTNGNIVVLEDEVKLPKLGKVKANISRPIEGKVISATVSFTKSGKYFVSVCCTDVEIAKWEPTLREVGIDLGIKDFAITSDGDKEPNPKYLKKSLKRLKMLQKRLSRKQKGSNHRNQAIARLAKLHEYIANQRENFLQQYTTWLVKNYDLICIENMNVKGMMANHCLAQAVGDVGMGRFSAMMNYKALWYGKAVQQIGRFYPSSQTCHICGYRNPEVKDLSIREWDCVCGAHHDRDINAAKSILNEGKRLLEERAEQAALAS